MSVHQCVGMYIWSCVVVTMIDCMTVLLWLCGDWVCPYDYVCMTCVLLWLCMPIWLYVTYKYVLVWLCMTECWWDYMVVCCCDYMCSCNFICVWLCMFHCCCDFACVSCWCDFMCLCVTGCVLVRLYAGVTLCVTYMSVLVWLCWKNTVYLCVGVTVYLCVGVTLYICAGVTVCVLVWLCEGFLPFPMTPETQMVGRVQDSSAFCSLVWLSFSALYQVASPTWVPLSEQPLGPSLSVRGIQGTSKVWVKEQG